MVELWCCGANVPGAWLESRVKRVRNGRYCVGRVLSTGSLWVDRDRLRLVKQGTRCSLSLSTFSLIPSLSLPSSQLLDTRHCLTRDSSLTLYSPPTPPSNHPPSLPSLSPTHPPSPQPLTATSQSLTRLYEPAAAAGACRVSGVGITNGETRSTTLTETTTTAGTKVREGWWEGVRV